MTVDPFDICSLFRDQLIEETANLEEMETQMPLTVDKYLDADSKLLACAAAISLELSLQGELTSDFWKSILEEFLIDPDFSFQDCDTAVSDYSNAKQQFLEDYKNLKQKRDFILTISRDYLDCLREAGFQAARR